MIHCRLRTAGALVVAAVLTQAGCQRTPRPAAPDEARSALRQALDAWQQGEAPDAFGKRSSLTVVEPKWRNRWRLVGYELAGDGRPSGFDWQCPVKLSLRDARGKAAQERAVYTISTAPVRVIIRAES